MMIGRKLERTLSASMRRASFLLLAGSRSAMAVIVSAFAASCRERSAFRRAPCELLTQRRICALRRGRAASLLVFTILHYQECPAMAAEPARFVLTLACEDRRGIVAAVANSIASQDCNIVESAQYGDPETERFFMRVSFSAPPVGHRGSFTRGFGPVALGFGFDWQLHDLAVKPRVLILVSKFGHCLNDLLYRHEIGHLPMELVAVGSNHETMRRRVEAEGIAYVHWPVDRPRQGRAGSRARRASSSRTHRPRGARPLHAGPVAEMASPRSPAAPSTSTTRSCRASSAPGPITRPTSAASS